MVGTSVVWNPRRWLWIAVVLLHVFLASESFSCVSTKRRAVVTEQYHRRPSTLESKETDNAEISPFYRRDQRYWKKGTPTMIQNATGLAELLRQRFDARRSLREKNAEIPEESRRHNKDTEANNLVQKIDHELREYHRVRVYDYPRIWSPVDSEPPAGFYRLRAEKMQGALESKFGPRGHPFRRVGSTTHDSSVLDCPLSEVDLHRNLQHLTEFRISGQHETAQALQFELSLLGVRIQLETLEWTTDPDYLFPTLEEVALHQQSHSRDSPPLSNSDQGELSMTKYIAEADGPSDMNGKNMDPSEMIRIRHLLLSREKALAVGNTLDAELVRLELFSTYRVGITSNNTWAFIDNLNMTENFTFNTESYMWIQPDLDLIGHMQYQRKQRQEEANNIMNLIPPILLCEQAPRSKRAGHVYTRSATSLPVNPITEERILDLIEQRSYKRDQWKFLEADAIRKELWCTYNVGLNDRLRQYSIGGRFEMPVAK